MKQVERRVAQVRGAVAALLRAAVPGAAVEETGEGVAVTGRGLVRRWIADPRLRDPAGWLK